MTEIVLSRCDVREQKFQSPPLSALAELIKRVRVANVDFHFQWFPVGFIWNWRHVLRIVKRLFSYINSDWKTTTLIRSGERKKKQALFQSSRINKDRMGDYDLYKRLNLAISALRRLINRP